VFHGEIILKFLNGAEECEAFMAEWKENRVNLLEANDMIVEIIGTKLEGIYGSTGRTRYQ
jgi:hypothetical protein